MPVASRIVNDVAYVTTMNDAHQRYETHKISSHCAASLRNR